MGQFKTILKETYKTGGDFTEDKKKLQQVLNTKSLIGHIFLMLPRAIYPIFGVAYWQKTYEDYEDNSKLDADRVASSKTFVYMSLYILTVIGVILDIACLRRRSLSRWILPYELVYYVPYMMCPWDFGDFETSIHFIYSCINFIVLSSKMNMDAPLAGVFMLVTQFGSMQWISSQHLTVTVAVGRVVNALFGTAIMVLLATIVTYIAVLRGNLANLMSENIKLLDKMNEGMMVLSPLQLKPVFASKPAIKILKQV